MVRQSMSQDARPGDAAPVVVGVDVGGTFTDILALDAATGRVVFAHKLP